MNRIRFVLGAAGFLLAAFGAFRLLTEIAGADLLWLAVWLIAALVLHDGLLAPVTAAVGVALQRMPPRPRRYVQAALVCGAGISVIAAPLIIRRNSQPAAKSLLQQNYAAHLAWLWCGIAVVAVLLYGAAVIRDRRARR